MSKGDLCRLHEHLFDRLDKWEKLERFENLGARLENGNELDAIQQQLVVRVDQCCLVSSSMLGLS